MPFLQKMYVLMLGTFLLPATGSTVIRSRKSKSHMTATEVDSSGSLFSPDLQDSEAADFMEMPRLVEHTEYVDGVPVTLVEEEGTDAAQALLEGNLSWGWHAPKMWIIVEPPSEQMSSVSSTAQLIRSDGFSSTEACSHERVILAKGTWSNLIKAIHGKKFPRGTKVESDRQMSALPEVADVKDWLADGLPRSWGLDRIDDAQGLDNSYDDFPPSQGEGVDVFVLDTGIRTSHQDFGGRASAFHDVFDGGACTPANTDCAADRNGHGTHCAGTVGGTTLGVAKRANLRAAKVLSDRGSGSYSGILSTMEAVVTEAERTGRPSLMSMSLGGAGVYHAMAQAVDAAMTGGVAVVVAAGNSNSDACRFSPAFAPNAITVGSTDRADRRSGFSNFGTCIDIWAPGSSIFSAWPSSDVGTRSISGTSMACPHVAGAMALLLGEEPFLSVQQVTQRLKDRSTKNAISGIPTSPASPTDFLFTGTSGDEPPPPPETPAPTAAPTPGQGTTGPGGVTLDQCKLAFRANPSAYGVHGGSQARWDAGCENAAQGRCEYLCRDDAGLKAMGISNGCGAFGGRNPGSGNPSCRHPSVHHWGGSCRHANYACAWGFRCYMGTSQRRRVGGCDQGNHLDVSN